MTESKPRRPQGPRAQLKETAPVTLAELGVADEIEHVLDTALVQLMFGPDAKAMAEELSRQAASAPPWPG